MSKTLDETRLLQFKKICQTVSMSNVKHFTTKI